MANYAEYKDILGLMKADVANKEDVYTKLMTKEESIKSMLKDLNSSTRKTALFYERPLLEIISTVGSTWHIMFNEMVIEDMYRTPHIVFWQDDRKIYTGILLVILALVLLLIDSSQ